MIRVSLTKNALASLIEDEPEGVYELVGSMRDDYQIVLAEQVLRANAQQARVTVVPSVQGDARADALAQSLTDLYWAKLRSMLEFVAYGRVAFEKVYEYKDGLTVLSLRELPYEYSSLIIDDNGSFGGIQVSNKSGRKVTLMPEYAWWLALDATPLQPHGRSRFLGAPQKVWQDRQHVRCLLKTFSRRFALGSGIIRAPQTFKDPLNPDGPEISTAGYIQDQYSSLENGGLLMVPNDRVAKTDGSPGDYLWDVQRLEVQVRDGRPILDIVDAMDAQQLLAFGIPPKTVMEGDAVGSFALVTQQMLMLLAVVEEIVSQLVESYQKYVVDKCAQINMQGVDFTVNFTPLTERPDDLANEIVKAWLTNSALSPIIEQGLVDVVAILESSGVAVSQDAAKKFQSWVDAKAKMAQAAQDALLNGEQNPDPADKKPPLALSSPFLGSLWNAA